MQILYPYVDPRQNHEIPTVEWRYLNDSDKHDREGFVDGVPIKSLDHWHDDESFGFYNGLLDSYENPFGVDGHYIAHKHGHYKEHAHYVLCTEHPRD